MPYQDTPWYCRNMARKTDYMPPSGLAQVFTLHLSGENYDYVFEQAMNRGVARNRAVNEIIAEHRAAAAAVEARKAKRNGHS